MSPAIANGEHGSARGHGHVPFLPLSYNGHDSDSSALKLILTLAPDWASQDSNVEFVRFTEGITNTLLKAVNRRPGLSKQEVDDDAILLRAYGNGTAVLIDREREAENHELLWRHGLATELLARFENGMLYRFLSGTAARAQDLSDPPIRNAIACRLAQWHATVPCLSTDENQKAHESNGDSSAQTNGHSNGNGSVEKLHQEIINNTAPGKPRPNVWTVMQKWILALPTETEAQRDRQALLQRELKEIVQKLSQRPGLGENGLVFAHCDLLCANVIIHRDGDSEPTVSFIDYEYATPSPAAFDLANHFAEWVGFDCDYKAIPTQPERRDFIREYVKTYFSLKGEAVDQEEEVRKLIEEVDVYRGVPGFYWGIWSLIQAVISEIDFDYAQYAELRLGEYWACKAETDGSRESSGKEMPLREKTWWSGE